MSNDSFNLKSVKSHAQLTQTANNVRIISQNLSNATIKLNIKTIMIVTKPGDSTLVVLTTNLINWLLNNYASLTVYSDVNLKLSIRNPRLKYWDVESFETDPAYSDVFDLILTLGGDGTVLFVSQLFQKIVPPVLAFSLGSLGFLTNFKYKNYIKILTKILKLKYVKTNLRLRLTCDVVDARTKQVLMTKEVLNEITIDRGPNPFLTNLALYGNDSLITITQADGLCVATPTGSTAYSLAAGGSLVHPYVSAISVTPICPHTLSFRPIILPDSMELKVIIPRSSRCDTSWVSFDGKSRYELTKDTYVVLTASEYYFPTVMNGNNEYFDSVSKNLNWNTRKQQKPLKFSDVYDLRSGSSDSLIDEHQEDEYGFASIQSLPTSDNFPDYDLDDDGYDDDYIETPIIPFQDINEALEIFSDEELLPYHQPLPSSKSRSASAGSSKKIRTNSFTSFNQAYKEKIRLDTKVASKFNSLKINNGSSISIGINDLKGKNKVNAVDTKSIGNDTKLQPSASSNNNSPEKTRDDKLGIFDLRSPTSMSSSELFQN